MKKVEIPSSFVALIRDLGRKARAPILPREKLAWVLVLFNFLVTLVILSTKQSTSHNINNEGLSMIQKSTINNLDDPDGVTLVRSATDPEKETFLFHNGGFDKRGSCWCNLDDYCMCTPSLAIDLVIVDYQADENEEEEYVWLVKRRDTGQLAVMGGFVQVGETTEEATLRELREETGLSLSRSNLALMGVYSSPGRDKRRHTVSAVYIAMLTSSVGRPKAGDDVKDVVRMSLSEIEALPTDNFFADHKFILMDYKHRSNTAFPNSMGIGGGIRGGNGLGHSRSLCTLTHQRKPY